MSRPPLSRIVDRLAEMKPFTGPETLERRTGRALRARIGANENAFGCSPRAAEAMARALGESALYGDPENLALREAIADRYRTTVRHVLIGAGIDELLSMTARLFLDPDSSAVGTLGSYPMFPYVVRGAGATLHTVPYRNERLDVDALAVLANETDARLVYVANPDNPSGSQLALEELARLRQALPPEAVLILDEAYVELADQDQVPPLRPDDPQVLRFRTFSKVYGLAGARVACAIGEPATIAAFDRIRLHFGVNRLAQVGAIAALGDSEFVAMVRKRVAEGRRHYEEIAHSLGIRALPSRTNFVALDVGSAARSAALQSLLLERDVFVRLPWGPPLDRCIRASVGREAERSWFAEALASSLRELHGGSS